MSDVIVCSFSSVDEIKGVNGTRKLRGAADRRVYGALKASVVAAGRFSVFEATASQRAADLYTRLTKDFELETFDLPFPWTGVRERST